MRGMIRAPRFGGIAGVEHDQTGVVDPAVGIFEGLGEQRLQRLAGRVVRMSSAAVAGSSLRPPIWS